MKQELLDIYDILRANFGHRNWWPAKTKDEIIIGAILTQSVSWSSVTKAIENLKNNGILTFRDIRHSALEHIAELIKPTRFYNQKTTKLMNFAKFFDSYYKYDHKIMFGQELYYLRKQLLGINGIGKETADSILLYAGNKPIFVCDAYTARILTRFGISEPDWKYDDYQKFIMDNLPLDVELFNDYHAQICHLGKNICKKKPVCDLCPLLSECKRPIKLYNELKK